MKLRNPCIAVLLLAAGATPAGASDLEYDLLVFGSAELYESSGFDAPVSADFRRVFVSDQLVAADVLFSLQKNRFRLFGEQLVTNHESDLERFQIGWEATEDTVIWLGRFHQASSVWNHEHHHGQFLQTSITRPASEEWEDQNGILPQHFTGLLVESNWHLAGNRGLRTAIGGGMAPLLTTVGLEPFDVTHPDTHEHQLGFQARIGFLPDELGESGFGLLFAHNELNWEEGPPPALAGVTHFDQTVIGLFGNYVHDPWRVSSALYYVDMEAVNALTPSHYSAFGTGYLQVERSFPHGLVVFGRREDSVNAHDSSYLTLFPNFVATRTLLGLRWDYHRRQALTLQVANSKSLSDDSYVEYRLQWSGALF
ncbi:MAG TPA: hypothetical protein VE046_12220 [Steroidobacteraceae bacterium]|nr:hypothetical protein [Steroidobacteraceae bacterium]